MTPDDGKIKKQNRRMRMYDRDLASWGRTQGSGLSGFFGALLFWRPQL